MENCVKKRQVPNNINELDDIMKAIAFIDNNKEVLYIREVSLRIYGDSKYFENNVLLSVCAILRKYNDCDGSENEIADEVLEKYNIFKEPQKFSIKGNVIIYVGGKEIDISALENGIEISASEINNIDSVKVNASVFMTIENRTSYLRYSDGDKVIFYLGEYANRFQRDFINKVHKDNPNIIFEHFGDIDAGGFWIHHNLCQITGIHFKLFSMSVNELNNTDYTSCLHKLSDNDIQRLKTLYEIEEYKEVVHYMIENRVKLEQEIVSLNLMKQK